MMDLSTKLGFSIIKHLQHEFLTGNYPESKSESLEVAIQCLEQAYDIDSSDSRSTVHLDCGKPLLEMYTEAIKIQTSGCPTFVQPSEYDIVKAEHYKTEGNDFVKADKYHHAIESYSAAINLDGQNAVYYCNRAAAYTKLGNNKDAIDDCEKAARIDPKYSKAYGRMGLAYLNLEDYQKAVECYEKALQLESTNLSYENNLSFARDKLNEKKHAGGIPGGMPNLGGGGGGLPNLGGLDVGALLSNPAVMNMAQNFMQNPQMQNMFSSLMGGMQSGGSSSGGASSATMSTETDDVSAPEATSAASSGASSQPQPGQMNFTEVLSATQQFAQQMQRDNPELVEQLRTQFQQGGQSSNSEDK